MKYEDPIISVLLEENILDDEGVRELVDAQNESGRSLISLLKSREVVDQDQLTRLSAIGNGIEYVDLRAEMIDPVAVKLVSYETARQHSLIPVRIEKDTLYVAMSSPLNLSARDSITTKTGYKVVPLAASAEAVRQAITNHFNVESVTKQDIVAMRLKDSSDDETKARKHRAKSTKVADAPIVRLVDSIITSAIDARCSDIHIEPQEPDMKVRYRVDGILIDALDIPVSAQREVISHIKILANMDISEKRIPQDGHISISHNDKTYDLRISSLPATNGEKIVMRILDSSAGLQILDQLISNEADYRRIKSLIAHPYGMILLTGPTGSGKTTTLYSMIGALNTPERNIVTVEDPVEYRISGITQVQVRPQINMTFAASLRSILRQDPDVILIGEIRDLETAEIAISSALTGHLVLSTLHTNDAAGAISRLVNLGAQPFNVASAVLGAVAQRLVRTICPKCRQEYSPTEAEVKILTGCQMTSDGYIKTQGADVLSAAEKTEKVKEQFRAVKLYRGKGCQSCRNTGYCGREGIYEILETDSALLRSMIIEGASDDQLKACAQMQGMKTLKAQGIERVLDGHTTIDELARVVNMKDN
jgi:type IV pilus assembly protein PilB